MRCWAGHRSLGFLIICVPVIVPSVIYCRWHFHLCLMIVGGAKQPFETTFRVCVHSTAAQPTRPE